MIPLALFLLGVAAIYVGCVQASFSALMRLSLRIMAERGSRSELTGYLEDPARLFIPSRLLLGVIVVLSAELMARLVGVDSLHKVGLLFAFMVGFLVVCEHLVPWLIVRRNPQQVLETLLPSFRWLARAMSPFTRGLCAIAERRERTASDEEQGATVQAGDEAGAPPAAMEAGGERQLLRSIVGFGDRLVREVMTPRPDIVAIQGDATLADLRAFFKEQEYSRIPVYKDDIDNVLGFAFVKDLIKREDLPPTSAVTELMRPAFFVPETKRVPELLKEFQHNQVQTAVVVDEYGGTAGLVTLEDLLEELVGEIRDEYDVESEPIAREDDRTFLVSGRVAVDQVADRLAIEIPGQGFETFGGYLLSRLGRVPAVGERFELDDLDVEVLEADRRRILHVRVSKRQPAHEEA